MIEAFGAGDLAVHDDRIGADIVGSTGFDRAPGLAARMRIQLCYLWRHGRLANLVAPQSFTELVQHRKLTDRNPALPRLVDKVAVKAHVGRLLGPEWVIPLLWHGDRLPDRPHWRQPIVLKSRHGCNQSAFLRTPEQLGYVAWAALDNRSQQWLTRSYGGWLDEWAYRDVPRGLLIEPFVGENGALPIDYKIYVFGGRAAFVQVHLEREKAHRWMLFDLDWKRVSAPTRDPDPARPASLADMIAAAELLGRSMDFVRADFYEVGNKPLFGELTFYPGSGLDPFDPPSLDRAIGAHWLAARQNSARAGQCASPQLMPVPISTPSGTVSVTAGAAAPAMTERITSDAASTSPLGSSNTSSSWTWSSIFT